MACSLGPKAQWSRGAGKVRECGIQVRWAGLKKKNFFENKNKRYPYIGSLEGISIGSQSAWAKPGVQQGKATEVPLKWKKFFFVNLKKL